MSKTRIKREPEKMKTLMKVARNAAKRAHAPYSNFRVGAAVLGSSSNIYEGANIENASYGIGTCAERVAIAAATMAGEKIEAIAVACVDAQGAPLSEKMPCGACRQWIQELAPHAEIMIDGENKLFKIGDLLPLPFRLAKPKRKRRR